MLEHFAYGNNVLVILNEVAVQHGFVVAFFPILILKRFYQKRSASCATIDSLIILRN